MIPIILFSTTSRFTLLAIPFFILAGLVMERVGISRRLIDLMDALIGHVRGGLAMVAVVSCCLFSAISGSAPATVAAIGLILIPAMTQAGTTGRSPPPWWPPRPRWISSSPQHRPRRLRRNLGDLDRGAVHGRDDPGF